MSRIDEIKERMEKATDGPWEVFSNMVWDNSGDSIVNRFPDGAPYFEPDDADFIAHSRTDVPWLVSEVDRLQAFVRAISQSPTEHDACPLRPCDAGGNCDLCRRHKARAVLEGK